MNQEGEVVPEVKGLLEEIKKHLEDARSQTETIEKLTNIITEMRDSEKKLRNENKELANELERVKGSRKAMEKDNQSDQRKANNTTWRDVTAKRDFTKTETKEKAERPSQRLNAKEIIERTLYFNGYRNEAIRKNRRVGRGYLKESERNGTTKTEEATADFILWLKMNSLEMEDVIYADFMRRLNSDKITVKVVLDTRERRDKLLKSWASAEEDGRKERGARRDTIGAGWNESKRARKDWRWEEEKTTTPERSGIKSPNTPKKVMIDQGMEKDFNDNLGEERAQQEERKGKEDGESAEEELKEEKGDETGSKGSVVETDGEEPKEEVTVEEIPFQTVGRDGRHRGTNANDRLENTDNNNNERNNSNMGVQVDKRLRRDGLRSHSANVLRKDEEEATSGDKGKGNK